MTCTDTDNYVNVLSTIKKRKEQKKNWFFLKPQARKHANCTWIA